MIQLYDILEKARTMETVKKITDSKGYGLLERRERLNSLSTKDFQGSEMILFDTIMMDSLVAQR